MAICRVCEQPTNQSISLCQPCSDQYLPQSQGIATIQRNYIDLSLLIEAIKLFNNKNTQQINYEIEQEFNQPTRLKLSFSQYAMNPNGFHVGYETFQATYKIVTQYFLEENKQHKHEYNKYLVWLDDFDFECTEAPESERCDCTESDDCQCELYFSPKEQDADIDYVLQEFDFLLGQILEIPLIWKFQENAIWTIIDRNTEKIIWEP
jgi:hypothetical protein